MIDEVAVEAGVVGDQRRVGHELQELLADLFELRLVQQEIQADAVHRLRLGVDLAAGMDVAVEMAPGRDEILELQARHFDQPVAGAGIQAGGLGIEDDLAGHVRSMRRFGGSGKAAAKAPGRVLHGREDLPHLETRVIDALAGVDDEVGA